MAKGPKYVVKFRRLRERRTNYKLRFALLKSGKPFFIVRRSLRYIYVSLS
ncbi:MAG TPA: 50S ribosomal protein L18, partial [Thermoprotei archaeon]|nr:50S ribosomal protein L18 [Thermoprotei archaeon]